MNKVLSLLSIALLLGSCAQPEPWQAEMTSRLDSMIVLSESHAAVLESTDSAEVHDAYLTMGELQVFFLENVNEMQALQVPKKMYTGPLYKMENCVKYYGRVVGSYTDKLDPKYNTTQLSTLRNTVLDGHLDSVQAVKYFNDEAFALRDADRRIAKSYGGCFECLRGHDTLVATLDSLKNYILATHAPQ